MFDVKEREGRKRRHQVDTIVSIFRLRAAIFSFGLHGTLAG
jgi:hypothetical protein